LSPWWRRRQVPPKRRFLQEPHGVTTQKTPFLICACRYVLSCRSLGNRRQNFKHFCGFCCSRMWRSWLRSCATSRNVSGSNPDYSLALFSVIKSFQLHIVLGFTQPLPEMSTRNIPGGKARPAYKADNLTAICEPIMYKAWHYQNLTTLFHSFLEG
jgi:hypothetical protein